MSSLTLTSWTCERCGRESTTDSADEAPMGWTLVEHESKELDLCAGCTNDLESFIANNTTRPRSPS